MSSNEAPKPYILYHSPCPDGFGSAYAAWRHFGDDARYIGVSHGNPPPQLKEGATVYMVDFSYKRDVLLEMARVHPQIIVIDHHAPAMQELEGIEDQADNIEVVFDNDHSGAVLTWKYFHPESAVPLLLYYVEDRDLWRFDRPCSKEISAALYSYPTEFTLWDDFARTPRKVLVNLVAEGAAILRMQNSRVDALVNEARIANIGGFQVPAVNAPYFLASDLGHALLEKYPSAPFSAVYREGGEGRRDWSLRSEDTREDVQQIAKIYDGGGHRNASGCSEDSDNLQIQFDNGRSYSDLEQDRLIEVEKGLAAVREEGVV